MGIVITTLLFGIPFLMFGWHVVVQVKITREYVQWGTIFALLCASTLVFEYPGPASTHETLGSSYILARADDGSTSVHRLLPAWCAGGATCYRVATQKWSTRVDSHVKPITENPKVRDLTYIVDSPVCDQRAFGVALRDHNVGTSAAAVERFIRDRVRFELYEFNNAHSSQLGELYNPMDGDQTARLHITLEDVVAPKLKADGLCIVLVSWDVQ